MSAIAFLVPGPLGGRSGGYEYDRRVIGGLRSRGWTVGVLELRGDFPHPAPADLGYAARALASIPDATVVVVDGLAFGAMPAVVEREAGRLGFVPIVHMPLAHDSGLDPVTAHHLEDDEKRALAGARLVVVTGRSTAGVMLGYGVPGDRIVLVEPGTDRAPLAAGSWDTSAVHLLCVGALTAGKGHDVLFSALARVPRSGWRLSCVGSIDRDPGTVGELRAILRKHHLEDDVSLAGEVDAAGLWAAYDAADLFVLATRHETFAMAVAEALARGLPVVASRTGAIAEMVGAEAGIIVPPGDVDAFAAALTSAMDPRVRERLADGARRARERLVPWEEAVATMAAALTRAGA